MPPAMPSTTAQAAGASPSAAGISTGLVFAALQDFVEGLDRDNPGARAWLDDFQASSQAGTVEQEREAA